jgi:hypothetical protein
MYVCMCIFRLGGCNEAKSPTGAKDVLSYLGTGNPSQSASIGRMSLPMLQSSPSDIQGVLVLEGRH